MCTPTEFLSSGRRIEDSGTDRDTTPAVTYGYVDPGDDSTTVDCNNWDSASGLDSTYRCRYSATSVFTCGVKALACATAEQMWCCSD